MLRVFKNVTQPNAKSKRWFVYRPFCLVCGAATKKAHDETNAVSNGSINTIQI